MNIRPGRLQELINEITAYGTSGTVGTGTPAVPAAGAANVAAPKGNTVTSTKPKTPQEIDAVAQVVKSAGLNPAQLNQVIAKAK